MNLYRRSLAAVWDLPLLQPYAAVPGLSFSLCRICNPEQTGSGFTIRLHATSYRFCTTDYKSATRNFRLANQNEQG